MKKAFAYALAAFLCCSISTAAVAGQPSKTLNIAISENIVTIDPHAANTLPSYQPRNLCMDPLIEMDHMGSFTPCLATSWDFEDGGRTVVLNLRKGVKFHNGEDFNADDVVCTFERLLNDKTLAFASIYWSLLKGVEKTDDYTVKVFMKEPYAGILINLANTFVIPDQAFKEKGDKLFTDQIMFGTGPWIFDEWVDGQYFRVTKNPNYWNKAKYDPYYDEVYVRIVLEPSTAIAGHVSGGINAYIASGGIADDMLKLYKGTEDRIELRKMDTGTILYLGLRTAPDAPFGDLNTRLAVAHAIDRQEIVDFIYGGGAVGHSFMVPGTLGYSDKVVEYKYDPEKAREYLKKSGYDGRKITVTSNTGTLRSQELVLAVSEYMNAVGFNTVTEIVEVATMLDMRVTGRYDMFYVASMQEAGDPMKYINARLLNDVHKSGYKDEKLNELIKQSNTELDQDKRKALLEEICAIWSKAVVHLPVIQLSSTYALDYGVEGIDLYIDGLYSIRYVDYNPNAKK